MSYVNCARTLPEQNLAVTQEGEELFYEVSRDIPAGEELLVWYSDQHLQFMGIPVNFRSGAMDSAAGEKIDHESE